MSTMVDIIFGIFCVVFKESGKHKKCKSVLYSSEPSDFSASFRYWPWALVSVRSETGQWSLYQGTNIAGCPDLRVFTYHQNRQNYSTFCMGKNFDISCFGTKIPIYYDRDCL